MMTDYALDAGPGLWRERPVWVRNDTFGEIVYTAPDEGLVPGLVAALIEDLRADGASHPIVKGAMAHLNLVMIHPFRDGNGRISNQVATTDLRAMVDRGFLRQEGRKRGTSYVAGAPVQEIRNELRAARLPIDATGLFDT